MMLAMPLLPVWILLWLAWVIEAWLAALNCRKFLRRISRPKPELPPYRPRATVIVPFCGIDTDLPACVRSLCTQEYEDYRVVCVLESPQDPATAVLRRELARFPQCRAEVTFAGPAGPRQGQKVHNQLYVLRRIDPEASDDEVWVFADSDAVPGSSWLANMVQPLAKRLCGVTTGYRWLVPAEPGGGSFWSRLASVCNSSIACFYTRKDLAHVWGGSMALRVGTAREGKLIDRLTGSLTDDYPITTMCRSLRKQVCFVAECLIPTPASYSLTSLINFGHRQYLITRVYAPRLYLAGLCICTLWVAGFFSACIVILCGLDGAPLRTGWWWAVGAAALVFVADQWRASARRKIVLHALGNDLLKELKPALRLDRWATPVWMTLHWLIILRSGFGRTMVWRGITFWLRGPQDVKRLNTGSVKHSLP